MSERIKETYNISKSSMNRLGKKIREYIRNNEDIPADTIDHLQEYRVSFKDDLVHVIQKVKDVAETGGSDSITSFRIKRIESILSKIKREPKMQLGNMGDIAGCRIMVYRKEALSKVKDVIHNSFKVLSVNDYISEPKADGYNGYHVYIESPNDSKRKLEIQLRTKETHQWSSLVEIIDNIYNLKLKEGQQHPELQRFILHLSRKSSLTQGEMKEVIEIDKKNNIYGNLNEVFLKNYYRIRNEWLRVKSFDNKRFFIFELKEDKSSEIHAFEKYEDAEKEYFNKFKSYSKSNFVLAHISKPKFKSMCTAYASYIMIQHEYLDDWNNFVNTLLKNTAGTGSHIRNLLEYSKRNLTDQAELIQSEINEIDKYESDKDVNLQSLIEWKNEINDRLRKLPGGIIKGDKRKRSERKSLVKWFKENFLE